MGQTQLIGNHGEDLAAQYLLSQGFDLLHRNWRSGHCELDLVAMHQGVLHIVEVKTRKCDPLTTPEEAFTATKFRSLCRAARSYVAQFDLNVDVQFDLIAVELTPEGDHTLRYLPEVMSPRW